MLKNISTIDLKNAYWELKVNVQNNEMVKHNVRNEKKII